MIRIIIIDDNPGFLQQLKGFLHNCGVIDVVGEGLNGEQAVNLVQELKPDLVLMDVRMNEVNGLEATRQIKDISPSTAIIILSGYDYQEYRVAASARGAEGYVVKKHMAEELCPAIQRVMHLVE